MQIVYPVTLHIKKTKVDDMTKQLHRILLLFFVLLVAVACRQEATLSADNVNLDITVTDSLVGETTLIVDVTDDEGNPIENPGTLNLRGDMDHAGMVPVIVDAEDSNNGVFTVPFEWTMGGAWTVTATLTLPDEETVTATYDYEILTEAGDDDMGDMEGMDMESDEDASANSAEDTDGHDMTNMTMDDDEEDAEATQDPDMAGMDMSGMDMDSDDSDSAEATEEADMQGMDMDEESDDMAGMHMGGETSAVYMQITNNGDDPVTIISANTSVASIVEIHETVIENDVARMQPVDSIIIEAGDSAELRPAGMHIMLMQLTEDITVDGTIDVELELESGDTLTVTAIVQDMLMDDIEGETTIGDLTFTNVWARPASAGAMNMDDMDMEETEESEDTGDMDSGTSTLWEKLVETQYQ